MRNFNCSPLADQKWKNISWWIVIIKTPIRVEEDGLICPISFLNLQNQLHQMNKNDAIICRSGIAAILKK